MDRDLRMPGVVITESDILLKICHYGNDTFKFFKHFFIYRLSCFPKLYYLSSGQLELRGVTSAQGLEENSSGLPPLRISLRT
jgi:hypothetical protein